jgi:hypothetical protein
MAKNRVLIGLDLGNSEDAIIFKVNPREKDVEEMNSDTAWGVLPVTKANVAKADALAKAMKRALRDN